MGKIKLTTVPFQGTAEQEKELREKLAEIKKLPGALMPALQAAQGVYGYLPVEVQQIVADELGVPLEKVFGVSTFYSQFTLNPRGKYQISVCLGTACYVKGSGDLINEVKNILKIDNDECTPDRKFSLLETRCIGCCGLAPVLSVNDEVYGRITAKDVAGILAKYSA